MIWGARFRRAPSAHSTGPGSRPIPALRPYGGRRSPRTVSVGCSRPTVTAGRPDSRPRLDARRRSQTCASAWGARGRSDRSGSAGPAEVDRASRGDRRGRADASCAATAAHRPPAVSRYRPAASAGDRPAARGGRPTRMGGTRVWTTKRVPPVSRTSLPQHRSLASGPHGRRTNPERGSALTACQVGRQEMVGCDDVRADNVPETVRPREEVRPMNVVRMWVLPLSSRLGD